MATKLKDTDIAARLFVTARGWLDEAPNDPDYVDFAQITGIEHVESKTIQGASIMKLQFHPGTDMSQALSETVAYVIGK
mgnify:CR=1 FL=1